MALQSRAVAAKRPHTSCICAIVPEILSQMSQRPLGGSVPLLPDDMGKTGLTPSLFPDGQRRCAVSASSCSYLQL